MILQKALHLSELLKKKAEVMEKNKKSSLIIETKKLYNEYKKSGKALTDLSKESGLPQEYINKFGYTPESPRTIDVLKLEKLYEFLSGKKLFK